MPILSIMIWLIQLALIVHVLKTGRSRYWIMILLFMPLIGGVAYLGYQLLSIFVGEPFSAKSTPHQTAEPSPPDRHRKTTSRVAKDAVRTNTQPTRPVARNTRDRVYTPATLRKIAKTHRGNVDGQRARERCRSTDVSAWRFRATDLDFGKSKYSELCFRRPGPEGQGPAGRRNRKSHRQGCPF